MSDASQVRINELARELEVKAKAIIDLLPGFGVTEKKTHSSSIPVDVAEKVRRTLQGTPEVETKADVAVPEVPKPAAKPPQPPAPAAAPLAAKPAAPPLHRKLLLRPRPDPLLPRVALARNGCTSCYAKARRARSSCTNGCHQAPRSSHSRSTRCCAEARAHSTAPASCIACARPPHRRKASSTGSAATSSSATARKSTDGCEACRRNNIGRAARNAYASADADGRKPWTDTRN